MNKQIVVINNADEFNKFYHYWNDGKYYPSKYPDKYPCLCFKRNEDGGLMGDSYSHYVVYYPVKKLTQNEAFIAGLKETWQYLC